MPAASTEQNSAEFDLTKTLWTLLTNPVVFLTGVSVLSYTVVLVYEWRYCRYFDIPFYLVTVSGSSNALWLHIFGLLLLLILLAAYSALCAFVVFSKRYRPRDKIYGAVAISIVGGLLFPWVLSDFSWSNVSWLAEVFGLFEVWAIPGGCVFLTWWDKRGRRLSYVDFDEEVLSFDGESLSPKKTTRGKFGFATATFLTAFLIPPLLLCAGVLGRSQAQYQTRFLVLPAQEKGAQEMVVLYSDGEHFICAPLICAPLKKPQGKLQKSKPSYETACTFVLLDRSLLSQEKKTMQLESIGPLRSVYHTQKVSSSF